MSDPISERGSQPLPPDASIADILARVEHLSAAGKGDTSADAVKPDGPEPLPPSLDSGGSVPPPAKARRSLGRFAAAGGGLIAVLIGLGAKILLGVAVVGVGGHVLSSLFGGPFDRLPQATRDGFEQRLNAAIGPDAAKLSDSDYTARYNAMVGDGESRLDDGPLVQEVAFLAKMFDKADTATCAAAARSELGSKGSTFELSNKMWEGLSQAELTSHIETQVQAIEAAARKSPAQRTVSAAQANSAVSAVFVAIDTTNSAVLDDLVAGKTRSDDEACKAARALHQAEASLGQTDLNLLARYSVSP